MARETLQLDLRAALEAARNGERRRAPRADCHCRRGSPAARHGRGDAALHARTATSGTSSSSSPRSVERRQGDPSSRARAGEGGNCPDDSERGRLRRELRETRAQLEGTIQELESLNEEYRSAHEEALSANEELQSSNEELETAKEELQSTNEELTTVNDELQDRSAELGDVNNDLRTS